MIIKVSSAIYSKIAVLKAAYHFTDKAYILIDHEDGNYIIHIDSKDGNRNVEFDFNNELLFQELRHEISQETKDIRTIMSARALASTVISMEKKYNTSNNKTEEVLSNWFSHEDSEI